ncbi:unnamed protein product [Caretta caretta]
MPVITSIVEKGAVGKRETRIILAYTGSSSKASSYDQKLAGWVMGCVDVKTGLESLNIRRGWFQLVGSKIVIKYDQVYAIK